MGQDWQQYGYEDEYDLEDDHYWDDMYGQEEDGFINSLDGDLDSLEEE